MSGLKYSHVVAHRRRKDLVDGHRGKLEAHKGRGPVFAAAVEQLLSDHEEVESWLGANSQSAATPSTVSSVKE